jgi:hypothetical protein
MTSDPIVDEIHKVRERLLEECGGDIKVYLRRLKEREQEDRHRLVSTVEKAEEPAPSVPSR